MSQSRNFQSCRDVSQVEPAVLERGKGLFGQGYNTLPLLRPKQ